MAVAPVPRTRTRTVKLLTNLEPDIAARFTEIARADDRTVSSALRRLAIEFVREHEDAHTRDEGAAGAAA
jgi:urease accessory protein UreF